jgi:hypothetical protein
MYEAALNHLGAKRIALIIGPESDGSYVPALHSNIIHYLLQQKFQVLARIHVRSVRVGFFNLNFKYLSTVTKLLDVYCGR